MIIIRQQIRNEGDEERKSSPYLINTVEHDFISLTKATDLENATII